MPNKPCHKIAILYFVFFAGNLFAQDSSFVLHEIVILGNKHTKKNVILREIPAEKKDTICCPQNIVTTTYNRLTGLKLFNLVEVNLRGDTLVIRVTEKYYIWGLPRVSWADRNFNVWLQTADPGRLIYGGTLFWNNIAGRNHTAYLTLVTGYNQLAEIGYSLPFQKPNTGWSFGARAYYWTNHELWYKTENNRLQFLRLEDRRIQENIGFEIQERKRLNYYQRIEFTQGRSWLRIDSAGFKANPNYMLRDTSQRDNYVVVEYIFDKRNRKDYPTKGFLFRVGGKIGGIKALVDRDNYNRDDLGYNVVFARYSLFRPVLKRSDLVFAGNLAIKYYGSSVLPYHYTRQLGYGSDYVRGYEPYVADGAGLFLVKTGLRKALINNRVYHLGSGKYFQSYKKVPLSIWFNIFVDAGHTLDGESYNNNVTHNTLNSVWQIGSGVGFDFVAWYNALLRLEYSFNRMGEGYFNLSYKNAF